jgi:hypothetical protein
VTAAADTPFFPEDLVARLPRRRRHGAAARAGRDARSRRAVRHPTFGLWPVALREDLRARWRGAAQGRALDRPAWRARGAVSDAGVDPFFNVNTPEDLARAADLLAGRHEGLWRRRLEERGKTGLMERLVTEITGAGSSCRPSSTPITRSTWTSPARTATATAWPGAQRCCWPRATRWR